MSEDFHPDFRWIAPWLPRQTVSASTLKWSRLGERLQRPDRAGRGEEIEQLGPITVHVFRPPVREVGPVGALLWVHGGGYVLGTSAMDRKFCARVADELGIIVAAVNYRRPPEHPFPTPLYDCHDALEWLASLPEVDPSRVAIGGMSAGGGLAAALALLARDRGVVAPAFQLLSCPMLDDRTSTRTDLDESHVRLWNNTANRFGWESYLGTAPGSPDVSALAAPARHEDLSGLPPAWLGVGTCDIFLDEDVAYATRLQDAGVPCELLIVPGVFHGFDSLWPRAAVSRQFRDAQVSALRAALGAGTFERSASRVGHPLRTSR
jgi:acetyl esterase/lipase